MAMLLPAFVLGTEQIHIGIFDTGEENVAEIRLSPDFTINSGQTVTSILYTIRWDDPGINLTLDYIFPYFVSEAGTPVEHSGFFYQVFVATPMDSVGVDVQPGEEILISSFSFEGGTCSSFEIINDEWTAANNGNYYCALQGSDKTGSVYESVAHYGSYGGYVSGGGEIWLGQETGPLTLTGHQGTVQYWERKHNDGPWEAIAGTGGSTTHNESPPSAGTWQYRAAVKHNHCPVDHASPFEVVVHSDVVWSGAENSDWFNPNNWSGPVPGPVLNVEISATGSGNYPIINNNAACNNLVVQQNAMLTIGSEGSLTVTGHLGNEAGADALVIASGPDGSGSLIHHNAGVQARVQQHVAGWNEWPAEEQPYKGRQLLSSMVAGQAIQPHFVADPPSGDELLHQWDEGQHEWISSTSGNEPPFAWNPDFETQFLTGKGYLGAWKNTTTHAFVGALQVEDVHIDGLSHTSGSGRPNAGWHLMGNPFASAINWFAGSWERENLGAYAQRWNTETASYEVILADTGPIDLAEGFMIYVKPGETGSLTIPASARIHKAAATSSQPRNQRIILFAEDLERNTSQQTIIKVDPEAPLGFSPDHDVTFLRGYAPAFHTVSEDQHDLALNAIPQITPETSILLGFEKNHPGQFRIVLQENIDEWPAVFLQDLKTNTVHPLHEDSVYAFDADVGDNPQRFRLLFEDVETATDPGEKSRLHMYVADNQLYIENPDFETLGIKLFSLSGQIIRQIELAGIGYKTLPLELQPGIYLLRVQFDTGVSKKKIIVQ